MKKESINFFDLTKRELAYLKESYVKEKVSSMNNEELKNFVRDNIKHQITETIGDDEEKEAWLEMESFYGETFEMKIEEIKKKFEPYREAIEHEIKDHEKRKDIIESNKPVNEKTDMWED